MQEEITRWFQTNKRDLPWRKTNPWGVLVSEFMLQQTPVSRVLPVWRAWMQRWPKPKDLAAESRAEVIRAWGNLGYPRRAIRLHETSQILTNVHGGTVPRHVETLRTLPGVGEYTASAISAFAFGERALVLDTNIRRLFSRMIDGKEFPPLHQTNTEKNSRRELIPEQASLWAAATMELGALVCKSQDPQCDFCPVSQICKWRMAGYPRIPKFKKKQGWHGTNRQCRGVILKELRTNPLTTRDALLDLWSESSQLDICLETLVTDGLITKQENVYRLAD